MRHSGDGDDDRHLNICKKWTRISMKKDYSHDEDSYGDNDDELHAATDGDGGMIMMVLVWLY